MILVCIKLDLELAATHSVEGFFLYQSKIKCFFFPFFQQTAEKNGFSYLNILRDPVPNLTASSVTGAMTLTNNGQSCRSSNSSKGIQSRDNSQAHLRLIRTVCFFR